eukprot:TRINITY_DN74737_c0_g1_i1.p1 TRINITY_DN74737_c0_g1~~TRINITY_DN74737_c0_g1_i1.p1  ORF type:complete len:820 (-),score=129.78 TRINITY_DN74737_c0_g1_i1:127-2586(-)
MGLYDFYLSGELTDCELHIEGCEYKCHRVILANKSKYFKRYFTLLSSDSTCQLQFPCSCTHIFPHVIFYLYEGHLPAQISIVDSIPLLVVATRLQIDALSSRLQSSLQDALEGNPKVAVVFLSVVNQNVLNFVSALEDLTNLSKARVAKNLRRLTDDIHCLEPDQLNDIIGQSDIAENTAMVSHTVTQYLKRRVHESNSQHGTPLTNRDFDALCSRITKIHPDDVLVLLGLSVKIKDKCMSQRCLAAANQMYDHIDWCQLTDITNPVHDQLNAPLMHKSPTPPQFWSPQARTPKPQETPTPSGEDDEEEEVIADDGTGVASCSVKSAAVGHLLRTKSQTRKFPYTVSTQVSQDIPTQQTPGCEGEEQQGGAAIKAEEECMDSSVAPNALPLELEQTTEHSPKENANPSPTDAHNEQTEHENEKEKEKENENETNAQHDAHAQPADCDVQTQKEVEPSQHLTREEQCTMDSVPLFDVPNTVASTPATPPRTTEDKQKEGTDAVSPSLIDSPLLTSPLRSPAHTGSQQEKFNPPPPLSNQQPETGCPLEAELQPLASSCSRPPQPQMQLQSSAPPAQQMRPITDANEELVTQQSSMPLFPTAPNDTQDNPADNGKSDQKNNATPMDVEEDPDKTLPEEAAEAPSQDDEGGLACDFNCSQTGMSEAIMAQLSGAIKANKKRKRETTELAQQTIQEVQQQMLQFKQQTQRERNEFEHGVDNSLASIEDRLVDFQKQLTDVKANTESEFDRLAKEGSSLHSELQWLRKEYKQGFPKLEEKEEGCIKQMEEQVQLSLAKLQRETNKGGATLRKLTQFLSSELTPM